MTYARVNITEAHCNLVVRAPGKITASVVGVIMRVSGCNMGINVRCTRVMVW